MELSYDRTGAGAAVVLIHGITENRSSWDPLISPLAEHFDVLAVDVRCHGRSPCGDASDTMALAADVRDTVVASGLMDGPEDRPGPLVVGHSMGGAVATFYGAAFPARGIVNIDQTLQLGGFKDALTQLEPMLRGDEQSFQEALTMIFSSLAGALPTAEAERIQSIRRPRQDVILQLWSPVLDSPPGELDERIEVLLRAITSPYLAIHGDQLGPGYSAWLTALLPTATVEVWPGLGHYPHLVDPQRFVARIRQFDASI
jgi:pimeloyl-ACP methyl ester carboxylesterase